MSRIKSIHSVEHERPDVEIFFLHPVIKLCLGNSVFDGGGASGSSNVLSGDIDPRTQNKTSSDRREVTCAQGGG